VLGREVATLVDQKIIAGEHQVIFDGSSLASGIYFARLESSTATKIQKLVLLK
jgi:hypothetical protein